MREKAPFILSASTSKMEDTDAENIFNDTEDARPYLITISK
jgi:hypothetical protein